MKRILFIPAQTGLAHLLRSQAVAIELQKRGYEVHIFIDESRSNVLPKAKGITEHCISVERLLLPEAMEDFTRKRFTSEQVQYYVNMYRQAIDDIDPDFTVVDTELFGLVAIYASGRKFAFIINALVLPLRRGIAGEELHKNPLIQAVKNGSGLITNRFIEGMLRDLLKKYGDHKSISAQKLLSTITIILPEWAEYVHLRKYFDTFNYVGPILNPIVEKRDVDFERKVKSLSQSRPIVYISFGGTGFSKVKLKQVTASLVKEGYFALVSTGTIAEPSDIDLREQDGYVAKYLPGLSATALADCVVTHCSQGTVVQAILEGTPIVGIPFNLDQLVHAFKVEEFGIGINSHKLKLIDLLRNMYDAGWLSDSAKAIPVDRIVKAVKEVIMNPTYLSNLRATQKRFGNKSNGAEEAADIIVAKLTNSM